MAIELESSIQLELEGQNNNGTRAYYWWTIEIYDSSFYESVECVASKPQFPNKEMDSNNKTQHSFILILAK